MVESVDQSEERIDNFYIFPSIDDEKLESGSNGSSMLTKIRIFLLHLLLLGCYALVCTNLFLSLNEYGWDKDRTTKVLFILGIVTTALGGIVMLFLAPGLALKDYTFKYWNLSTFLFIISALPQYGIGFHYSHLNQRMKDTTNNNIANNGTAKFILNNDHSLCTTLEDNYLAFMTYLLPLPVFIFCDVLYPRPKDSYLASNKVTLVNTFAMLDILDLAELMFADGGCFQTYELGWTTTFYIALAASVILMTFSYGLEHEKDTKDHFSSIDLVFTLLNLLFNDLLFLVLRGYKVYKQKRAYVDVIFISKEISAVILRSFLALAVYFCF